MDSSKEVKPHNVGSVSLVKNVAAGQNVDMRPQCVSQCEKNGKGKDVAGGGETKQSGKSESTVVKIGTEEKGEKKLSTCHKDQTGKPPDGAGAENSAKIGDTDVVMTERMENGDAESSSPMDKSDNSPDEVDDEPSSESGLFVLDEVEESLDDKDDNGLTIPSNDIGHDAKTSSEAGGENNDTKDGQQKNMDDPYAYVKREDFTSEKFKIEIRGLPRFYGYGELKKFLNDKLKLSSHKMKPTRNKSPWVFVCFKNEEDRQAALKTLNRLPWKGKMLTATVARPAPDPLVKKRKLEYEAGLNHPGKKFRINDEEKLRNSTTPYWNLSYDEQLKKKYEYVLRIMCKLADQIMTVNPMLVPWIKRQKAKYRGMACNLQDIRKSPTCDGYRNKCEFTIGINEETKQRMVGFRLGSYVQGHVGVGPIDSLKHIPQRMKDTVKVFEKFIKESDREPFNPETHTGHWRQLTLRLTTLDELMAVVLVNSKGACPETLALAKGEVKEFFESGEGKDLKVNSLYFQAFGKREAGKEPPRMEHLLGSKYISESILGLKFRISPEAFFQVNTPGAGILYSTVGEMIDLNPSTTLVDVCCGTGTIGLSLAKDCGQVLGLEVVGPAIEDAKVNAIENNITNCEFFTGRAEEILNSVLSRAKGKSVQAVVDPPRGGLQQKAIVSLRGAEIIDKIVYVSCDPNAALKNFVDLARVTSKVYRGYPLVPISAIPVDMFPHTAHCEVVMLFQRISPINLPKIIPAKDDDISILSESISKSLQQPPHPPIPENKEGGATENSTTETVVNETNNDNKTSESVNGTNPKDAVVDSLEQKVVDKQKIRRKRPGRNQRLLARGLLGLENKKGIDQPPFVPVPKVPAMKIGSGPTVNNKPSNAVNKPAVKNKTFFAGKIGKFGFWNSFKKDKFVNKDNFFHNNKLNPKMIRQKNLDPKLGDPGNKKKWRKDFEPQFRAGGNLNDEEQWPLPQVQRGGLVSEDFSENYPKQGGWNNQGSQHRNVLSRSPPPANRLGLGRRGGSEDNDDNLWLRLEQGVRNWIEERERPSGSPPRKMFRRDDRSFGLGRDGGHFSPIESNFQEEWHNDVMPSEHSSRPSGKDFCSREEEIRFGRMRPERSPVHEPDPWGKRRRRESLSPVGRYEDDEFRERMNSERMNSERMNSERMNSERMNSERMNSERMNSERMNTERMNTERMNTERMNSERWGPSSDDAGCEEGFNFRRKYSDVECVRPDISEFGERRSRRSCERFSRRSPEMLKRRSNSRSDRRFCERFERRSLERFERRSSERFDQRSSERFERSPCERCERRSSERACMPQQQSFTTEVYREGRQDSGQLLDDFIGSRRSRLLEERETVAPKFVQQMEPARFRQPEMYNESEVRLSVNYRENRNSSANDREYLPASSPPRPMSGMLGSVELHRKNEVYVYRGPNDVSLPLSLERRIPISHTSVENRASHFEKRYESNVLQRNYDGDGIGGEKDHSVIARRVEVVRRPFMVDNKYRMLVDTTGKSLGTAEVLVVTAKNQIYDGDNRSKFNPNEGAPAARILEQREMSLMRKPWNTDESPPQVYLKSASPANQTEIHSERPQESRPQANWTFERRPKEIPRPWCEMEGPKPVRDQPNIPDANASKYNLCRLDIDDRNPKIISPVKNPGVAPNVRHNMEPPLSYPTPQVGYGPKLFNLPPNSQAPSKVSSHLDFPNKLPENLIRNQNAPFFSMPPSTSRMPVPYQHMNSSSLRPPVYIQNPPPLMSSGMPGTQQLSSLVPKPIHLPIPMPDIPNQLRMPSVPGSAPDPKINSWNFKGINPWGENNQQMMLSQKHW